MDVQSWLRKQLEQASPDLLRAMVQHFTEALMGAEADAFCGAPYGERSPERVNIRNGYRERGWGTRVGTIELAIPKLRQGSYFPDWLLQPRRPAGAGLRLGDRRRLPSRSLHATGGEARAAARGRAHEQERIVEAVRGRLAVQALDRLAALERDAGKLEREIRELLRVRGCAHLLAIRGGGPVVAATILGETRGIGRFRSAAAFAAHSGTAPVPASSGRTQRHRLNRSTAGATGSATERSTRSPWCRLAGTPQPASTSTANSPRARAPLRPDAA
jgi:Transposase, Mutator family/Transposase IS116/IS110/IS902 family